MCVCREAVYDFGYQTAVLVRENKSPRGECMVVAATANGFLLENGEKRSQKPLNMMENYEGKSQKQTKKQTRLKIPEFPTQLVEEVYKALKLNRRANTHGSQII